MGLVELRNAVSNLLKLSARGLTGTQVGCFDESERLKWQKFCWLAVC